MLGEAVERHQHDVLVGRLAELLRHDNRQLRHRATTITAAPDQRGRPVQVRRNIGVEVIDEQLAIERFRHKTVGAG